MPALCRKTSLSPSACCQSTMSLSNWAPVALFARVLELVERQIFGIEQGPVLRQEVVVDRLVHVVLPTAARPVRAGAKTIPPSRVVARGTRSAPPESAASGSYQPPSPADRR